MINDPYYKRRFVISGIAVAIVLVYSIRLFYLQVIDQSTKDQADNNALVKQTIYPSRGLIYDRNGELLVFNQPIYEITLTMRDMGQEWDTLAFCRCLQISRAEFDERMDEIKDRKKNRGYSRWTPQVFMSQLKKEDIATLQESIFLFPGVQIQKRTLRDYTYNAAAHVLGSVGEVSQSDIDRDPYYSRGDYSGRDGLERTYEQQLRGEKGVCVLMRDVRGRIQGSYQDGELDVTARAGTDLYTTLDIQLQMLAEELLAGKIGSAVAIEPKTGEILALASSPAWNPKVLVGKERSKNYMSLLKDKTKPLMNRATQATYPPGSTFKTIQALVCLQQGAITPYTLYPCSGPGSTPIKCTHHHGSPVALDRAIEQSCNPYFWCAFRDLLQMDGYGKDNEDFRHRYELWREAVMSFGLGQRFTDSDLSEQSSGSIPNTKLFDKFYGKTGWKAITIRSLSIGQGEILVTPLQLANQAATIANEGYFITPHLNRNDSMLEHVHRLDIDQQYFDVVKEGMGRVMVYGTGRHYAVDSLHMAGKTGTVQNPHGRDHAIFIGFAPVEDPQIAVAVVVENAGFGATWACPIATMMIEQYLTGEVKRKDLRKRIGSTVLNESVKKW
ncbi:MAG: penicillin-binding protein 2 [Paludibacteraceae bacterium]|nr:penicillin-binding protein 2 [Paludibacteraceae bacterium]MBQ4018519.1 penicillin-binding protein 2 [Paludibacteraceae bacterium]